MPKSEYVSTRCQEIEQLLQYADSWAQKDERLGAHLAAYICILLLGVLEDCIEHLIVERARRSGDPELQAFVTCVIGERFRNPSYQRICETLDDFSQDYKRKFVEKINRNSREAEALENIVANRHSLAHEGTGKLNLTVRDMSDYYRRVMAIVEAIEEVLS